MMEDQQVETQQEEAQGELWHRQPSESAHAYDAFKLWLEMPKRSLSDVARDPRFNCSVANISRWARLYDWEARAYRHDVEKDEQQRRELALERVAARKRHLKLAAMLQSVAAHGLAELQHKIEQKLPLNLSLEECKSSLAEGIKIERSTLGEDDPASKYVRINVIFGRTRDEPGPKLLDADDDAPPNQTH
jgi:hypothetical protein